MSSQSNGQKPDQIGALWLQEKNGKRYMTGKIKDEKIVIFKNNFKKNDTHPDYVIYASFPKNNSPIQTTPEEEPKELETDLPF